MGAVRDSRACLIVGAGSVTAQGLLLCGQLTHSIIIAADGGYLHCNHHGLTPDIILGDFDSSPIPSGVQDAQVFSSHKDDTDCMLAVKEGLHLGCTEFTLLGCTGGRLDHTIANIQTLVYLANHGCTTRMVDERHILTVVNGSDQPTTVKNVGGYLSIFSLGDRCTGVTLIGTEYPLTDATIENSFPLGVSNHIVGAQCEIYVKTGTLLIMTVLEGEQS